MRGTIYSGGRGAPIPGLCILVSSALLGTSSPTQHSGTYLVPDQGYLDLESILYPKLSYLEQMGWALEQRLHVYEKYKMDMFNFGESRALHSLSPDMPLYGACPE